MLVLDRIRHRFPWLQPVWADAGDDARQVKAAMARLPVLQMEIVRRSDDTKGFEVRPRRWIVERTFSWLVATDVRRRATKTSQARSPPSSPSPPSDPPSKRLARLA